MLWGSSIRIQSGANGSFGAIKFRFQQGVPRFQASREHVVELRGGGRELELEKTTTNDSKTGLAPDVECSSTVAVL